MESQPCRSMVPRPMFLSSCPAPLAGGLSKDLYVLDPRDGGWMGFVLAALKHTGASRILWIQDRLSIREAGCPGTLPTTMKIIQVELSHPKDVLFAAEEGLRAAGIAGVVAEIWGNPLVLGFTATKRLAFRAERTGVACWLIRHAAAAQPSAVRDRWRVASLPSLPHPDDPQAPGAPRWRAELFRSRDKKPGTWIVSHDPAGGLCFLPELRDRAMGTSLPSSRRSASG